MEVRLSKRTDHCDVPCHGLAPLPRDYSGRLPSSLVMPVGSLEAIMPAENNDRKIMSFIIHDIMPDYSAGSLLADQAALLLLLVCLFMLLYCWTSVVESSSKNCQ